MDEYPKIQSVYKRDPETNYRTFLDEFSLPEISYLAGNIWYATEKVDGTNIRIGMRKKVSTGTELLVGGRTDNAQIPAPLFQNLCDTFLPLKDQMCEMFEGTDFTLYGEGFGGKIQKGSKQYGDKQRFILFDAKVGEYWLKPNDLHDVALQLGLLLAPMVFVGTLLQAVAAIKEDGVLTDSEVGGGKMEGYVLHPATQLQTRSGHRIITKLKRKDYHSL